jgi:hypothetical protein
VAMANVPHVPRLRTAADLGAVALMITDPETRWPEALMNAAGDRPICVLIGAVLRQGGPQPASIERADVR